MTPNRILVVILASALVAGIAAAGESSGDGQVDYFGNGRHVFYVWCPPSGDFFATAQGASATDAQLNLYKQLKATGTKSCWPVWQGRMGSHLYP